MADFGDELLAPLIALRDGRVWRVCLRESKEGERGACEGEETADVLVFSVSVGLWFVIYGMCCDLFYSTKLMYLACSTR